MENIPAGVAPWYPRSWHLLAQDRTDAAVLRAAGRVVVLSDRRAALADGFAVPPLRWSLTAGLLWHFMDHLVARSIADARAHLARAGGGGGFAVHGPATIPWDNDDALYRSLARTWALGTEQVHLLAEANGIRSYHVLQPSQYLEGTKPLSREERLQAYLPGSWLETAVRSGYPHLQRELGRLREKGIRMIDLTTVFRHHPETLYIDSVVHVSSKGSAIMADAIADAILADVAGRGEVRAPPS